jgi:hypothetical protein
MSTNKKRLPKLTLVPRRFVEEDYVHLVRLFASGGISDASKSDLEHYAVMLSRPDAQTHIGRSSLPQACETVRTLLLVRMSEAANAHSMRMGRLAKWIAIAAIVVTAFQVIHTIWPMLPASSTSAVASETAPPPVTATPPLPEK